MLSHAYWHHLFSDLFDFQQRLDTFTAGFLHLFSFPLCLSPALSLSLFLELINEFQSRLTTGIGSRTPFYYSEFRLEATTNAKMIVY